jgi:ABC-type sugar transport system permease subunit
MVMGRKASLSVALRRENRANLLFVAPQFILYFTFILLPLFVSLPVAFLDFAGFSTSTIKFAGLANFVSIFKNSTLAAWIWPAVGRTFIFMIANYLTVLLFGMGLALLMYELVARIQRTMFVVIYLPYIISGLGVGMFIEMLFARDTGSINLLLQLLHVIREPINLKSSGLSLASLVLFVGWRYAGFNMAIFLSGLLTVPVDTIDAAKIDGASYVQRFRHVYLPQIVSSIAIATISCLVGSFGIFDECIGFGALYGNKYARLFSVILFGMGSQGSIVSGGKLSEGVASSIIVFVPLIVIAVLIFRWQKRRQVEQG